MSNSSNEHKLILFDTTSWLSNAKLKLAPYTIKGVWIDLMCYMSQSEKHGYLIIAGDPLSKDDIKNLLNFKTAEEFEKVWVLLVDKYKILKYDEKEKAYFSSRMVADYNKHHLNIHIELPGTTQAQASGNGHNQVPQTVKKTAPIYTSFPSPKGFIAPTLVEIQRFFLEIKKEEGEKATFDIQKTAQEFYKTYSEKNWIIRKLPPMNMKEECRKWVFKSFAQNDSETQVFDAARQVYPGMKNGLLYEFKNFQRQKDYKQSLPLLLPAIEKQKKWREKMKGTKGQFVPEWKFFTTWINQRCWEQEMPKVEASTANSEGPIRAK